MHNARVRTFPGAVPVGLRNILDVPRPADVDVRIGGETGCIRVDGQVRTRLAFLCRLGVLVARDLQIEVGVGLVTD